MISKLNFKSLLRLCVFFIFIGRAYQFLFFGAPIRSLLWDESLMSPIIEGFFNISWYDYSTNLEVNYWIEFFTQFCGVLIFITSLVIILGDAFRSIKLSRILLKVSLVILVAYTLLLFKSKGYRILEIFEMFIQLSLPLALLLIDKKGKVWITMFLKIAVALTFIAHGMYAMGIPFRPGHFIDMTIGITGFTENQSTYFLSIVGFLDVVAALLLFFSKTLKVALFYILIWGTLTALARVVYGFNISFVLGSLHNSLYATIYRLPHGFIAAVIGLIFYTNRTLSKTNTYEK